MYIESMYCNHERLTSILSKGIHIGLEKNLVHIPVFWVEHQDHDGI